MKQISWFVVRRNSASLTIKTTEHDAVVWVAMQENHVVSQKLKLIMATLTLLKPGIFLLPRTGKGGGGGLRRPYTCNSATAYCMTPQFTQNDVVIISII